MKQSLLITLTGLMLIGLTQLPHAFGQDARLKQKRGQLAQTWSVQADHPQIVVWSGMDDHRLEAMAETWRDADSERDRNQVKKVMADWLSREFDDDLEQREAELEEIEARVAKLRDQLDRRVESKDDIIDLQIKQMTMSWDGLGWEKREKRGRFPSRANVATAYGDFSFAQTPWGGGDDGLKTLILDAVQREDDDAIEFFSSKLQKAIAKMNPEQANAVLWGLFEETQDSVQSEAYWQSLAEAAAEAAERFEEEGQSLANTLDTVAHLYEQAGNLKKALEYQQRAIETSENNGPFGTSEDLQSYFEELKEKSKS